MRNWIIGTLIVGSIFYTLAGSVNKKFIKVIDRDNDIVTKYENLLNEMSK